MNIYFVNHVPNSSVQMLKDIMHTKYKVNIMDYIHKNNIRFEKDEITEKSAQIKIKNHNVFYMEFINDKLLKSYPPDEIYINGSMEISMFLSFYEDYKCDYYICKLYNKYKIIRKVKNNLEV